MELPDGAALPLDEKLRVKKALEALESDVHAPREISVKLNLHIHHEYPKMVGNVVVNSAEEEKALSKSK